MVISIFEQKLKVQQIYVVALVLGVSLVVGYLIPASPFMLFLLAGAVGWVATLPYHAAISVWLSVATFSAAFIVPLFPGRPFLWEFAALLGWSGLVLVIALRRYHPLFWDMIRANRWLFISMVGYCLVLFGIMAYRGVGLRILGTSQMGGRFYFQQLVCVIFPVLFVMLRLDEKTITRLFFLQCILSSTFLISDFAFSSGGGKMSLLLNFFEVPGDAVNFEIQSQNFGLRRFQSLGNIGQGFTFALFIFYNLKDFYSRKGMFLLPAGLLFFSVGLYSGHRWLIVIVGLTTVFCIYTQRFITLKNTVITLSLAALTLVFVYGYSEQLPLTVQRAVSWLPGIDIDNQARADGSGTMETRRLLRRAGWDLIPEYFWIGRGFGLSSQVDYSSLWEPTGVTAHINAGKFYNGFIGLMVNTGVFGMIFMLMFMAAGTWIAWKIIGHLRHYGCEDSFSRTCCVVSGLWMANMIAFIAIHGDSELAMKSFSFQAGLMMACHRLLQERLHLGQS